MHQSLLVSGSFDLVGIWGDDRKVIVMGVEAGYGYEIDSNRLGRVVAGEMLLACTLHCESPLHLAGESDPNLNPHPDSGVWYNLTLENPSGDWFVDQLTQIETKISSELDK
jgi:hypothetical protein